jgi:hypothetical protein
MEESLPAESREPGELAGALLGPEHPVAEFPRTQPEQVASVDLPSIATAATGNAPTTGVAARFVSAQGYALRELLRSRESLRAAIVVSEVLGPPKGM